MAKSKLEAAVLSISLIVIFSVGYFGGQAVERQDMERRALANVCGNIDPKTLDFVWVNHAVPESAIRGGK